MNDVIHVLGHRIGGVEVESALVLRSKVSEAAVVGFPHDSKGQSIFCYVVLNAGEEGSDALDKELHAWIRKEIGPTATLDHVQFVEGLPQTRSLGDISILADPSHVDRLIDTRRGA